MSNKNEQNDFFDDIMKDPSSIERKLLGQKYSYWKQIKTPSEMGMSSGSRISDLEKDVKGLIDYVQVLVSGRGNGTKTGKPLGDKFFLQTGATCKAKDNGEITTRYIYVNNVPSGKIPFISQAAGMNFKFFRGLVPGIVGDLETLNPFTVFSAFKQGTEPECQKIKMETIDENNNKGTQSEYVATYDIRQMDPCIFTLNNKRNPVTNKRCVEGFENRKNVGFYKSEPMFLTPEIDISESLFYFVLSLLMLYLVYKIVTKTKNF